MNLYYSLQEIQYKIWRTEGCRLKRNHWDDRLPQALQIQEIQFPWRTVSIGLRIKVLRVFSLVGLARGECWGWGADLPALLSGCGIWRNPQSLSRILFYFHLGHFEYPETTLLYRMNVFALIPVKGVFLKINLWLYNEAHLKTKTESESSWIT